MMKLCVEQDCTGTCFMVVSTIYSPMLKPIRPSYVDDIGGSPSYTPAPFISAVDEPVMPPARQSEPEPLPSAGAAPKGRPLDYGDVNKLFVGDTTVLQTGTGSNRYRQVLRHGLGGQKQSRAAIKFESIVDARNGVDALATGPRQSDSVWALLKAPTSGVVALQLREAENVQEVDTAGVKGSAIHPDDTLKVGAARNWTGPSSSDSFDLTDPSLRVKSLRPDLLEVLTPYFTLVPDANGVLAPAPEGS
jgi:hypothetical protein